MNALCAALWLIVLGTIGQGETTPAWTGSALVDAFNEAMADAVAAAMPSVVTIENRQQRTDLLDLVRDQGTGRPVVELPAATGLGLGVIVDAERGHVLTASHVVAGARTVFVEAALPDGSTARFEGDVVTDEPSRLALVRLRGHEGFVLTTAQLGDSDAVRAGHLAILIGHMVAQSRSVSLGTISGRDRRGMIVTPALRAVQGESGALAGDSGGLLLNVRGEIIGITTVVVMTSAAGAAALCYAIPINDVVPIWTLLAQGGTQSGILGLASAGIPAASAAQLGLAPGEGLLVQSVWPGTAASAAGIRAGDVLLALNGASLRDPNELERLAATAPESGTAEVRLWSAATANTRSVTILLPGRRSVETPRPVTLPSGEGMPILGMRLSAVTDHARRKFLLDPALNQGAVVTAVEPDSSAARQGIRAGDVIVRAAAGGRPLADISGPEELRRRAEEATGEGAVRLSLVLLRDQGPLYRTVRLVAPSPKPAQDDAP